MIGGQESIDLRTQRGGLQSSAVIRQGFQRKFFPYCGILEWTP